MTEQRKQTFEQRLEKVRSSKKDLYQDKYAQFSNKHGRAEEFKESLQAEKNYELKLKGDSIRSKIERVQISALDLQE